MKKIIIKLEKFEDSVNKLLAKLIAAWLGLLQKLIPAKFFEWKNNCLQTVKNFFISTKETIIKVVMLIISSIQNLISKISAFKNKILSIDYGGILLTKLTGLKEFLLKTPLKSQVKFISAQFKKLTPKFNIASAKFKKYPADHIRIVTIATLMVLSGVYGIYISTSEIYQKENPYRAPASIQEYDERPEYKLYPRKTVMFQNISLPIEVENVSAIRKFIIDFSVRTSTRWARFYLENNETQLKDYFFTTVEPVVSNFPLKEEGKTILKEKIRFEINNFLRENGVEGEVEDVRILFVNAY